MCGRVIQTYPESGPVWASTGPAKSCLYINTLTDLEMTVLEDIVRANLEPVRRTYKTWDM